MRTECRCGLPGGVVLTFRDDRLHPVDPRPDPSQRPSTLPVGSLAG